MSKRRDRRKKREKAAGKTKPTKKVQAKSSERKAERLKPAHGELPNQSVMDAIADSVHSAVSNVFNELERAGTGMQPATQAARIKGRCLYYAGAGQWVTSAILDRDYCIQVGSLGVTTDAEKMFKLDAANGGVADRRFHMWLAADDGGFVEYVDFTSRFFKEWALATEAKWEREDLPNYLWGTQQEIREKYGVSYQVEISEEPEADKLVKANEAVIDRIVQQAMAIARKRLLE